MPYKLAGLAFGIFSHMDPKSEYCSQGGLLTSQNGGRGLPVYGIKWTRVAYIHCRGWRRCVTCSLQQGRIRSL